MILVPPIEVGSYLASITVSGQARTTPGPLIYNIAPDSVDINVRVVNETAGVSPDNETEGDVKDTGGAGIYFIIAGVGIIIIIAVTVWVIRRKRPASIKSF